MPDRSIDLLVIGGGINGAAISRDAAGRGLKTLLAEKGDYACGTSSASSKLIHGGLRYLEQLNFSLVRKSLLEREILLRTAPHLVWPQRFLIPITAVQKRPAWLIPFALKFYDLLAGKKSLAPSGVLSRETISNMTRLRRDGLKTVLHYSDCRVKDARLVIALLLDARSRGVDIANRREVIKIVPIENGYRVVLQENNTIQNVQARFVVNATGPWANQLNALCSGNLPVRNLRLVRGSHIMIPMPQPRYKDAFLLQNNDGRVVFVIPWQNYRYLMIGTTEISHLTDPTEAACSPEERDYLLAVYNLYFVDQGKPKTASDVIWSGAGVRPLVDNGTSDPSKIPRDATLTSHQNGNGGYLTVYGGKLTTHRTLAEDVMEALTALGARMGGPWTRDIPLHGGHFSRTELVRHIQEGPNIISEDIRQRWAFTYGDQILTLYEHLNRHPSRAQQIAPGVPEAELMYTYDVEDARSAEDFLCRRTELFTAANQDTKSKISSWFNFFASRVC